jgi:outer membrane protein OmpA-like peptidoglycan-associated protein
VGITPKRVGEGIKLTFNSQLLFNFGKTDLMESNKADLQKFAKTLNEYTDTDLLIVGHTDDVGSESFNQTLSEKQAASVSNYLASLGVGNSRLKIEGKGETQPAASNETEEKRSQNRRVEIAICANSKMKTEATQEAKQ